VCGQRFTQTPMHDLPIYEWVRTMSRGARRSGALIWSLPGKAAGRGEVLRRGGALDDPVGRAVPLFESASPEAARAFARADPYVTEGVVTRWKVRAWNTVAGEGASQPIRS
jgi:hypothetical protein